jgi:phage terminase large subunit-like protein
MPKRKKESSFVPAKRPNSADDPVSSYAHDVLVGRILTGNLVKLACERHFRDLAQAQKKRLVWRPDIARHAIDFARYCRHSKGEWAGQRVELAPWQAFVRGSAFGWLRADGLRRFRVVYEEVARKNGKACQDDTPVPTPKGWCRHGDLKPGDLVFNPFGKPRMVLAATESYAGPYRRMVFSDGTEIIAHDRHEWRTQRTAHTGRPHGSRQPLPEVETQQIAATLCHGGRGDLTHGIPTTLALDIGADVSLPLPPYTFGIWLGDGTSLDAQIVTADQEVIEAIRSEGVPIQALAAGMRGKAYLYTLADTANLGLFADGRPTMRVGFRARLRELRVWGDKHVPMVYLRASIRQRRELLAGLVDSDGHVTARGQCEVVLTNRRLFDGAVELARTLGFKPTVVEDRASLGGVDKGPRYRMQFWPMAGELPLRIPRKRDRLRFVAPGRSRTRMIVSCEPVGERMGKCITVEGGMYLAGEGMVPTHNSTNAATVALKCLVADNEPGADVYSAATKKEQARIVFDEARRMVQRSEDFRSIVKVFRAALAVDHTLSSFQPLSADDRTLDGLNPHAIIIDELHKHRNRAVLDVLDTAMGARRQPLMWIITTAGDDNPESVYAQERAYAENVVQGNFVDDEWLVYVATLDPTDRWDDQKVWIKANPNLGISVKLDDLQRQCRAAKNNPAKQMEFKRLRLNLRTPSATQMITGPMWDANSLGPFDPAELIGRRCFGGLDLSSKIDLSAWVKLFPPVELGERWKVVARFWMPSDTVDIKSDRDKVQYRRWINDGLIEVTEGNIIDHGEIQAAVLEDARIYNIESIAYDPWNAAQIATSLQGGGMVMKDFVQGLRSYTAPTKELSAMLLSEKLDHGGNAVMRWMALNLRVQTDKNDNQMPTKKVSIGRIDGISALIMAIGRSMADETAGLDGFLSRPVM